VAPLWATPRKNDNNAREAFPARWDDETMHGEHRELTSQVASDSRSVVDEDWACCRKAKSSSDGDHLGERRRGTPIRHVGCPHATMVELTTDGDEAVAVRHRGARQPVVKASNPLRQESNGGTGGSGGRERGECGATARRAGSLATTPAFAAWGSRGHAGAGGDRPRVRGAQRAGDHGTCG